MSDCLLCNRPLRIHLTLQELFSFQKYRAPVVCPACLQRFSRIPPRSCCPGCSRQQEHLEYCLDCRKWQKQYPTPWIQHEALFEYDSAMKEWLHTYKFQGDIRFAKIFAPELKAFYNQRKNALFVPLPISETSRQRRGFNQCEELLREAGIPYQALLENVYTGEKQSEKNRKERLLTSQPFRFRSDAVPMSREKEIILFDDVYTTGRTLFHAKEILFQEGFEKIFSLTLAR